MLKKLIIPFSMSLLLIGAAANIHTRSRPSTEIEAFWTEMARTVAEGDFEGYKSAYHKDAILVSGLTDTSYPISTAFDGWKQGFTDTREGRMKANVVFKFTQVLSGATTAHETGMFHYYTETSDGEKTDLFIHFEALLVKKKGWKMMMEYQKSEATEAEWDAVK